MSPKRKKQGPELPPCFRCSRAPGVSARRWCRGCEELIACEQCESPTAATARWGSVCLRCRQRNVVALRTLHDAARELAGLDLAGLAACHVLPLRSELMELGRARVAQLAAAALPLAAAWREAPRALALVVTRAAYRLRRKVRHAVSR